MELTRIQNRAVEEILGHYNTIRQVKVDFKAPTGSGKTLMASYVISSLIERNMEEKFIFVIATPSSSELPYVFEQKLNQYKKDLPFSKFDVEYIESPSAGKKDKVEGNPKIKPEINKVYIFGKASFGSGRIFTERHVIKDFIDESKNLGYKLVYIRDEAHIGDKSVRESSSEKDFEILLQQNADFILKMTATPNFSENEVKIVQIKESEINDGSKNDGKWLLKTTPTILLNESIDEDSLLEKALIDFKNVKKEYRKLEKTGIIINPALLIQVSNEPSNLEGKLTFQETLNSIKEKIEYHNLLWVQYFGDSDKDSNTTRKGNFSLDEITNLSNRIDIIIFKVGPSTGWDIPRACMLLQLRKVCSETLNIQTIGRIKRNPYPNLGKNEITDKYYIYSNAPKIDEDFTYFQYQIKDSFITEEFPIIEISNKKEFKLTNEKSKITDDVTIFIKENKENLIQEIKTHFVREKEIDIFREELYTVDGKMVYRSIRNPFIFLKNLQRLINSKKHINNLSNEGILKAYNENFRCNYIYEDIEIKLEHLQYVIFHNHTKDLMSIIKKNSPFVPKYSVTLVPYEPKEYVEIYDTAKEEQPIDFSYDKYLFDIMKNNEETNLQPLDSKYTETIVLKYLSTITYALNLEKQRVRIWAKNLASSNISGEYIADDNTFRKSFFDFIIKFENGIFLYIEVKSTNDIDPEKTALLRRAYNDYFEKINHNLFTNPVVISIWHTDTSKIVRQEVFYDKEYFEENLNELTYEQLFAKLAMHKI